MFSETKGGIRRCRRRDQRTFSGGSTICHRKTLWRGFASYWI